MFPATTLTESSHCLKLLFYSYFAETRNTRHPFVFRRSSTLTNPIRGTMADFASPQSRPAVKTPRWDRKAERERWRTNAFHPDTEMSFCVVDTIAAPTRGASNFYYHVPNASRLLYTLNTLQPLDEMTLLLVVILFLESLDSMRR